MFSKRHKVFKFDSFFTDVEQKFFTKNPQELDGELMIVTLPKTVNGFGFTLVGGDDASDKEEFLQIKNVIVNGPAFKDGRLKTGNNVLYNVIMKFHLYVTYVASTTNLT